MPGFTLRLALLLGLIIGPAGVLTFLSLRAALDEQRGALVEVRRQLPALRAALDERLQVLVGRLAETPTDAAAPTGLTFSFELDAKGSFVRPPVLTADLVVRDPGFSRLMRRGEALELGAAEPGAALASYRAALQAATTPGERAEALNALGRAAAATGDPEADDDTRRRLRDLATVLDPDGAHPLTLSVLRAALRPGVTAAAAGAVVEGWTADVLAGRIPFHPGTRLAARDLRRVLQRGPVDRPDLRARLDDILQRAGFIAAYDGLLETAILRPEATYLCGRDAGGTTHFALARPAPGGGALGAVVDLPALARDLMSGAAATSLRAAGFEILLFDVDDAADFERRHGDALRLVTPASERVYRLHLGVFSRDQPFDFAHHRSRSALLVGGIAFLAGAIALGVWVLVRETARGAETSRLRAEFVANVSHELRTPLTAIRLYAETLLAGRVPDEARRQSYLRTMVRESQRLARMVGNILDMSRLESGRKSFDFRPTRVDRVIGAVLDEFEPLLEEQGFRVETRIDPGLPSVPADAEALETALANLVGNAVKYSGDRRELEVRAGVVDGSLRVEIADRGIGIPEPERRAVFDRYHRAANAAGTATGAGLGLALVDGILHAHGGRAEALPRDGGGTRMRLTLPLDRSHAS